MEWFEISTTNEYKASVPAPTYLTGLVSAEGQLFSFGGDQTSKFVSMHCDLAVITEIYQMLS